MEDESPFSEQILEAISAALASIGCPGIVTGFVLAAEYISDDGDVQLTVTHPAEQSSARGLGLAAFAEEWIRDDIRVQFRSLTGFDE